MNFIKKYFKVFIGAAVLILVIMVFFFSQRSTSLETGTLKDWQVATVDRRNSAIQILTGAEKDVEILVACVDKMATLPDSSKMAVRDAAALCYTGLQLKDNL